MNYARVGKNIYSYTRANGRKTYRARKYSGGKMTTAVFHTLKDAKAWLSAWTAPKTKTRK